MHWIYEQTDGPDGQPSTTWKLRSKNDELLAYAWKEEGALPWSCYIYPSGSTAELEKRAFAETSEDAMAFVVDRIVRHDTAAAITGNGKHTGDLKAMLARLDEAAALLEKGTTQLRVAMSHALDAIQALRKAQ